MSRWIAMLLPFLFSASFAQNDTSAWRKKFDVFHAAWKRPKLHLIFNQEIFSPGDTVWFKAWFLREDLSRMEGKQLIEFNLINADGHSVVRTHFMVEHGTAQNQVRIPGTLTPGIYMATAHNDWMRNFEQETIFRKELAIVSATRVVRNAKLQLLTAPEGGKLVKHVPNRVAIWTSKPASMVELVNGSGKVLTSTVTDAFGTASLTFTPLPDERYILRADGSDARTTLPVPSDGVSIQVEQSGARSANMKLLISPGSVLRGHELVVITVARGRIGSFQVVSAEHTGSGEADVALVGLSNGVTTVCVLDRNGVQVAHRDFYRESTPGVRVDHTLERSKFGTRDSVKVAIALIDNDEKPAEGEFSVRVLNAGMSVGQGNLPVSEFYLLSEIADRLKSDSAGVNWTSALDNYLICRSQEIPWDEILAPSPARPRFGFSSALSASASVVFADTGEPVPDNTVVSLYLQKTKWRYQTFTLGGKIKVTFPVFFGDDEIFWLAATEDGEAIPNVRIEWDEADPVNLPRPPASTITKAVDEYGAFAEKIRTINEAYAGTTNNGNYQNKTNFEDLVAAADVTVRPENYLAFPTMAELIREVIPSIMHRRQGGKDIVKVPLPPPMNAVGDPVYVIDGRMTANTEFFLSLDPVEIASVKVVRDPKKLVQLGLIGRNGIVIVETKRGDMLEPHVQGTRIRGLSPPIPFANPNHTPDPERPDFRTTIFWNPAVRTDGHGRAVISFITSDDTGTMALEVNGVTFGGEPFSKTILIRVVR